MLIGNFFLLLVRVVIVSVGALSKHDLPVSGRYLQDGLVILGEGHPQNNQAEKSVKSKNGADAGRKP